MDKQIFIFAPIEITLEEALDIYNEATKPVTQYGAGSFYSPASNGRPPFFADETHTVYAPDIQQAGEGCELGIPGCDCQHTVTQSHEGTKAPEVDERPGCSIAVPPPTKTETPAKQLIIGINGVAQSGKDTAGQYLADNYSFVRIGFADALKDALYTLNPIFSKYTTGLRIRDVVDTLGWDIAKDHSEVRELLQRIGTEAGRGIHGQDCWLKIAKKKIDAAYPLPVVITDVRFNNEAEFVKSLGGHVVNVNRPGYDSVNGHASEQPIEDAWIDYYLVNDGDKRDLYAQIEKFIDHLAEKIV